MARFDDITVPQLPGAGRFDSLSVPTGGNIFSNIGVKPTQGSASNALSSATSAIGGAVGKIGEALTLGQKATTGLIEKGLEKLGILKPSTAGPSQAIKTNESNIDVLRRVGTETGQGGLLTGQYTRTTSVFGNFLNELPVTFAGTLGDVLLDPLNLLAGAGVISKATKGIGGAVKAGAKVAAENIPAVQKVGDALGKLFITRYGQRPEFKGLDIARKVSESLVQEKVNKLVSPVIEQPAVIQQRITQVLKGIPDNELKISTLAAPIRQELDRVGESISKLNPKLLSEETFAANKGTYFPRLYTDYEFPTKEEEIINSVFGSRAVSIPKEAFKGRVLTEAESLAKGTRIEEAGYPAAKRLTQLGITEQRQQFFKDISKLASEEAKPGWVQLSDDKALGALAGKFLPTEEFAAIAQIRKVPSQLDQLYGGALSVWKTFKTAFNPSTIARNDLTNFFVLNPLGGVGPHRLDLYARAANEMVTKGPFYQLARKEGLELSTQQAAELIPRAKVFYTENKNILTPFFSTAEKFYKTVQNFYGSQDKYFKLANFIKGVTEDGMTPADALRRANFYLIDYSEVPKAVEWLRKSPIGIPFISFTYGVSKPLAKTLLERPDKLANYFKILRGIQEMNPTGETPADRQREKDVLPDWISNGTYLRLPVQDKYGRSQYVDLQYILPFNIIEANGLVPQNPLLGIYASLFVNRDAFTGKDIVLPTDTPIEATQKRVTAVLSQLLPSFTPFVGTSFNKVKNALQKRPDRNGFIKSQLETTVDVLGGIKITPIDPSVEAQKRANERQKEIGDLRTQLKTIMLDKSLFPEERQTRVREVQEKIKTASGGQQ